jgi:hypothetical protein
MRQRLFPRSVTRRIWTGIFWSGFKVLNAGLLCTSLLVAAHPQDAVARSRSCTSIVPATGLPAFTASVVYGQNGSFTSGIKNMGGVSATSLSMPTGVAVDGNGGIYVADYHNDRVLHFPYDPATRHARTSADAVYGQDGSFTSNTANNGGVSATSLYQPAGVMVDGSGGIYVADTGNNRVLYFPYDPTAGRASTRADDV